ncbi:MAG: ABC transporter ATP-binding protein [Pelosinus sp.]|nr:ABC transporter ATP-binding protein [Pelosinus sp.]
MLEAKHLFLKFDQKLLFRDLSLSAKKGQILAIIGPNGSGKSTLLKSLARNLKPQEGSIFLDGKELASYSTGELACAMTFLPQTPGVPTDITVRDLIGYGRYPYQSWWKNTSGQDKEVVNWAIKETGVALLEARLVSTLSGGERQRVWLAMALAQQPKTLLLDEPTTYLDISHQLEILMLIRRLNKAQGITVVMVLHEINHAARFADMVAVMREGSLYAVGTPEKVVTKEMLREVFRVEADVWQDSSGSPVCIAQGLVNSDRI